MPVEGTWYNQVGDKMVLEVSGPAVTGTLEPGTFPKGQFPVTGFTDPNPTGVQVFCFTAPLINSEENWHVLTSSSGQLIEVGGQEEIVAQWLLTVAAPDVQLFWTYLTTTGQDDWKREPPSSADIECNRQKSTRDQLFRGGLGKVLASL